MIKPDGFLAVFAFAARAAITATRARSAATFAFAVGNDYFRVINRSGLIFFIFLVFHRAGILVFATRAAHRTFAVFTAISHSARMFFLIRFGSGSCVFLFLHRTTDSRCLVCIIRFRVSKRDDRQAENEQCRKRD